MKKFSFLLLTVFVSASFSQEVIRFQMPVDGSIPAAPVAQPEKLDTVQKPKPEPKQESKPEPKPVSGGALNLNALSAKDTDNFDAYSKRLALINDSISANYISIEAAKKNAETTMPALEPKDEFEKQAEYDARAQKWQIELAQRIERNSKPFTSRNEQLEKTKIKVMENQASLYGSLDIKTTPSEVSVWVGKEEIGISPMLYKTLIPGTATIIFKKDGWHQYDTTLQIKPGAKLKMNIEIEEKSIFSQENEINFLKILSKDTSVQGYEARIKTIDARIVQIDEEIKDILKNFSSTYPQLEVQKPDESPEAFKKRHDDWSKEGMRQYKELQEKHDEYKNKLERSILVLKDYIVAKYSEVLSEAALGATIELGAYDADKEVFALMAQDTASEKSPFLFNGMVSVPRDVAKNMNRSSPGFATGVQFINYPFETEKGKVNLAMSKLSILNNGQELKVDGSFSVIEKYKSVKGFAAWKLYADSLLSGNLKSHNLDYNYAMGKDAAQKAVADKEETSSEFDKSSWSKKAALALAVGAGVFGGLAVYNQLEVNNNTDKANNLSRKKPEGWQEKYLSTVNQVKDAESRRNVFGALSGTCAAIGIFAFFF